MLIFNCSWCDRFIALALTCFNLFYFLYCTLQPSPSFSGLMHQGWSLMAHNENATLIYDVFFFHFSLLCLPFLFLLRKSSLGSSSPVLLAFETAAVMKLLWNCKNTRPFSHPVNQVQESISPKAKVAACRSVFPSLAGRHFNTVCWMLREAWNGFMRQEQKGAFDLWRIYTREKEKIVAAVVFSHFFPPCVPSSCWVM